MLCKLALLTVLAVAFVGAQDQEGPFCYACVHMVADAKLHYNNDFKNVTAAELETLMDVECDQYAEGFADLMCKKLMSESKSALLKALQEGKDAKTVCKESTIC